MTTLNSSTGFGFVLTIFTTSRTWRGVSIISSSTSMYLNEVRWLTKISFSQDIETSLLRSNKLQLMVEGRGDSSRIMDPRSTYQIAIGRPGIHYLEDNIESLRSNQDWEANLPNNHSFRPIKSFHPQSIGSHPHIFNI